MNEEQYWAFRGAISEKPEDPTTRHVFADWLDENDRPEEANFYRSFAAGDYQESEAWLASFVARLKDTYVDDEDYEVEYDGSVSYDKLMDSAHKFLDDGTMLCLSFVPKDEVYGGLEEFWKHFQVVTGRYAPEVSGKGEWDKQRLIRCAC